MDSKMDSIRGETLDARFASSSLTQMAAAKRRNRAVCRLLAEERGLHYEEEDS